MDTGGVLDYERKRNSTDPWGLIKHANYVDKPLSEMETWTGFSGARGDSTSYATMAAELLAAHSGDIALIHYYTLPQPGTTWQEAFQAAFGIAVEEFYQLFEAHRAAGFPKVDVSK